MKNKTKDKLKRKIKSLTEVNWQFFFVSRSLPATIIISYRLRTDAHNCLCSSQSVVMVIEKSICGAYDRVWVNFTQRLQWGGRSWHGKQFLLYFCIILHRSFFSVWAFTQFVFTPSPTCQVNNWRFFC